MQSRLRLFLMFVSGVIVRAQNLVQRTKQYTHSYQSPSPHLSPMHIERKQEHRLKR